MTTKTDQSSSKWGLELADSLSVAEMVGYYSVDRDRTYLPDSSRLLYYNPPRYSRVRLDLNQGIESAVRRTESYDGEGMDHLLKWIKLNHTEIECPTESDRWIKPNFVSGHGLLRRLLSTRFLPQNGWITYAAKWKGTIYLFGDKAKKYESVFEDKNKFLSWALKFEKYIISDAPDKDPDTSKPVIEPDEFRCVYQNRLGDHTLLYSAIMNGVCSDEPLTDPLPREHLKFVELKISSIMMHATHERYFHKFKLLNWWCHCFLSNMKTVLCGFRDVNGIVVELKAYDIAEIIDMGQDYWDPGSCIDYCNALLTQISETVVNDCETTIYKFEKKPYEESIYTTEVSPSPEFAILPLSFSEATD